jgi:hypothetical protein
MANVATSRRAFLSGGAVALASTGAVATGRPSAGLHELDRLWGELLAEVAAYNVLSREYHERQQRLPWWAKKGPKYLVAKGEPERPEIGYAPAIQGLEPPSRPGVFRLLRPAPDDLERELEHRARMFGPDRARTWFQTETAAYEERQAAALAQMDRLGLPGLDARMEQVSDRLFELEQAIMDLPASLERVAALTLLATAAEARADHSFDRGDCRQGKVALSGLRPFLTGAVAESVADALDNPKRVMARSPLWTGYRPEVWAA